MASLDRKIEEYSEKHAGKALANFVNNSKVTYNRIGEYSQSSRGGVTDIVASGHQIYCMEDKSLLASPSTIFTKTSITSLDKSKIFKNCFGCSPKKLLTNYFEDEETIKEVADEIIKKAVDINDKKALVIQIKPKTECKINYELQDGTKKNRVNAKITSLKWETDSTLYKLKCSVIFEVQAANGQKMVVLPITDYGKNFIPDKVEYWNGVNSNSKSMIEMTDIGIVKPIEITDGKQSLVIDGTYLYWLHNNIVSVVGEWGANNNNLIVNNETAKVLARTDIYKFLNSNIAIIAGHRHLIAPYGMYDTKTCKVKEKK